MKTNSEFDTKKLASYLLRNLKPIPEIVYSNKPGIYAIGFSGDIFPWEPVRNKIKDNPIIYIGKTQSSSASRDRDGHFASGKSGSATFRRSIGAILQIEKELHPIPRSSTEKSDRKYRNYKFLPEDEIIITQWMQKNLSLSFWEYEGSFEKLKDFENQLIQTIIPPLNIQNNPRNQFGKDLKALRKVCAELAKANEK